MMYNIINKLITIGKNNKGKINKMNKIVVALMCVIGSMAVMAGDESVVTNVYDFAMNLRVPYLDNGTRVYKPQKIIGYMYTEYSSNELVNVWVEAQNRKTKVLHLTSFGDDSFYNLMGKTDKTSLRTVPTVFFEGADEETMIPCECEIPGEGHEFIKKIQLAGTGKLRPVKTVVIGCSACGETQKTTAYCNVLISMNGSVTGYMDCLCPEDEDWWHTVKTCICGVFLDDAGQYERRHEAAFWGTWKAKFNRKLSGTKIK